MSFENLGLSEALLKAVNEKKYDAPTPIQLQSIPAILTGKDVMACAQTGTGKTAGFTLPILQNMKAKHSELSSHPRLLILAPTRELALQIHASVLDYSKYLPFQSTYVFGGVKFQKQIQRLSEGVDVLVATPGRLIDLYQRKVVRLDNIETLVLDEADRMLDMGFIRDIKRIINLLPKQRQTLLFSATFSKDIRAFTKTILKKPIEIDIAPTQTSSKNVQHKLHPVDKAKKSQMLSYLIKTLGWYQALVFCKTKHGANKLVKQLGQKEISALAIHGNKSQNQRVTALESFKKGKIQILVATDVAARGLDIAQLSQVVNFDLPSVPEDYVHRIGRTGRAGEQGEAISLVCADEFKQLCDIEKVLKKPIKREYVDGFEPVHELPKKLNRVTHNTSKKPKRHGQNVSKNGRTKPSGAKRKSIRSKAAKQTRAQRTNHSKGR